MMVIVGTSSTPNSPDDEKVHSSTSGIILNDNKDENAGADDCKPLVSIPSPSSSPSLSPSLSSNGSEDMIQKQNGDSANDTNTNQSSNSNISSNDNTQLSQSQKEINNKHEHGTEYEHQQTNQQEPQQTQRQQEEYEPASCFQQTMALIRKNLLNKRRTPIGTLLELLSPAIFLLILVLGYTLSDVTIRPEESFAKWRFDLPNELLNNAILGSLLGGGNISDIGDIVNSNIGNNTLASFDDLVNENQSSRMRLSNLFEAVTSGGGDGRRQLKSNYLEKKLSPLDLLLFSHNENEEHEDVNHNHHTQTDQDLNLRMLQDSDGDEDLATEEENNEGYEDVASSFNGFRRELSQLLESPMPIPTITQFLALSQALSSQFNPQELDTVYQSSNYIRRWGNLLTLGTIHLSPKGSPTTNQFINYLQDVHNVRNITSNEVLEDRPNATSVLLRVHDDADAATEYVMSNLNERTFVVIHFHDNNEDENENEKEQDFQYTIRMNSTTLPNTNEITKWVSIGLNREYQKYYFSGHLTVQRTVNEFAIWRLNNTNDSTSTRASDESDRNRMLQSDQCVMPDTEALDVYTLPMPTPAYSQNPFFTAVGFLLGLSIAMSFLYPVSRLIKAMVEEKETRMKETLSILGVRPLAQWLSWVITASLSSVIIATLATLTLCGVMQYSSRLYLFLFILFFSFATAGFAFFVAAFFSKANLAAIVGPVALFITLLPRWIFFGSNRYEATASKMWASLLPCTAFAFGADILSDYEYAQVGIQRSNLNDGVYNFNTSLGFLLFDTILYMILGWYFEQVLPRQYGVAKKWYFFLTPSFWKEVLPFCSKDSYTDIRNDPQSNDMENGTVEYVSANAKLEISNLVKIYNPKKPPAINNLNLSMYDSEITCLLGHNGAGKSSTISVLTGLYPPTSGNCTIYGKSILHDLDKCRQSMGVCPQQNVLFNNLTVVEHLQFFERIKGISSFEVEDRAKEVGLGDFLHTQAGQLSGGNKRKLQLAIALAGEPRLVLLDEPTSGMDPYSRRATWELLRQKRHGRIILLTTHFMDEAEVLADRVAVLKEGSLQCCGSLLFLKQRFGLGYNITVIVDKKAENENVSMTEIQHRLVELLEKSVPGTRFIRESARELVFRFPPESESMFPALFDDIERESSNLYISSYGVSNTSLEEVFLQLADSNEEYESSTHVNLDQSTVHSFQYMNGLSQVQLLLRKRFIIQRRDLKGLFFKIGLPVILICCVLMVLLIDVPIEGTPIGLSAELYNTSGTGASIGNNIIVAGSRSEGKDLFVEALDGVYPSVDLTNMPDLSTSQDVSDSILDNLKSGRREFNFGSFILGDTISTLLIMDWKEINSGPNLLQDQIFDELAPELGTSLLLGVLNETLIAQNISWAESLVESILQPIPGALEAQNISRTESLVETVLQSILNDDLILSLLNQTLAFSNETIDRDLLLDALVDNLFNDTDAITIDVLGLSLSLTENNVMSIFNNEIGTYSADVQVPVSIMHNTSSSHSVAVFTQTYYDNLFKRCSSSANPRLSAINDPLPLTSEQSTEILTILSIIASILLAIPFNYIPAAFAVFVVQERSCKSKHLQLVSGVGLLSYWVSTYLWDMFLYMFLSIFAMLGFLSFGDVSAVFTGSVAAFFCTWIMIIGYGVSSLPFAYLLSRLFDNPPNAQISIMIIFFITGFIAVNAYFIMESIETTKELASTLRPLFRTWPAYNLGDGFLNLATNYWQSQISSNAPSPFSWDACGRQLFLLYALAPPYFVWLMFLEYSSDGGSGGQFGRMMRGIRATVHDFHNRLSGFRQIIPDNIDEDVLEEETAIREGKESMIKSSPIVIADLWKTYPRGSLISVLFQKVCCCLKSNSTIPKPKVAINSLSMHVENGVTFGLLGVNGAGKTTTMGILTGDATPTSGEAYVASHDVTGLTKDGVQLARKNIGFCPQVDPLLDLMTGRETLAMFGRLRGIPTGMLDDTVNQLLDKLTLTPHADKVSENYSGGNKRKLSLGIALIGNPKVLFIDESSSGMDPAARRRMWDLISEAAKDRAVILTTHSMEEAEALCNTVGIMINGRIRCLGGVQHLKQKFLGGYTLSLACNGNSLETAVATVVDDVERRLEGVIPGIKVSERHGQYITFEVPAFENYQDGGGGGEEIGAVTSLGSLFRELQELVDTQTGVVSYSVSQCTLEQVFINLVRDEGFEGNE